MKSGLTIALTVWLLLCNLPTCAQSGPLPHFISYHQVHYGDEDGLPSNDVTGFAEDSRGYFWFSTQFGLARFDGRHFLLRNTSNVSTLKSNRIFSLNPDSSGNIYFGDENTTVHAIRPGGQIELIAGAAARNNFLMSQHGFILDIRRYLKNKADSARIMRELLDIKYYLPQHEFYPAGNGNAWFLNAHQLQYFSNGHFTTVDRFEQQQEKAFVLNNILFVIDSTGNVLSYKNGARLSQQFSLPAMLSAFKDNKQFDLSRSAVCSNRSGAFLQYGNRLYAFWLSGEILKLSLLLNDLQVPLARDIYYSQRHRVYMMRTSTMGFYLFRNKPFITRSVSSPKGFENSFTAAVEVRAGEVLTSNGICFLPDTFKRVYHQGYITPNTLLKDRDNNIWFLNLSVLFCRNDRLQVLKQWDVPDAQSVSLQQDAKGIIWYCTENSLGRIDKNGQLQFVYLDTPIVYRTQCLFFLNDSIIWLGTTKGLYAYNQNAGTISAYAGMQQKYVRNIFRAKDGSIWLGTYGQGFYTYNDERFIQLPLDRQGYLSATHCFMEDEKGYFWIPTNKGLFQVLKAELDAYVHNNQQDILYYYYDKNDGFLTNEFNGGTSPVGIRLQNGTISLPSLNGLVWFHPSGIIPDLPAANIHIDNIMADTITLQQQEQLAFNAGTRRINIQVSSPFFGNAANIFLEYRLTEFDDYWTPVPAENTITLANLPAGDYTLEIRKRSGFGINHFTTLVQAFEVRPFFYERTIFKIFILALIVATIYMLFRSRIRQLRKKEYKLEILVQQRTGELNESVLQLKNTVAELKISEENLHKSNLLKDQLTSIILHDIRSPLRFINLLTNQLHAALSTGDNQQYLSLTSELKKSSDQLNTFTKEFLVWLTTQQAGFKIKNEYIDIQDLFKETTGFFQNILNWNNNKLEIDIKEETGIWSDKQLLKVVLHNLVDNANKHTDNGIITLGACIRDDQLVIVVADTGKGMTPEKLQSLRSGLESHTNVFIADAGSSLGYKIIKDFVIRLDGKISVDSIYRQGTTVTVTIPKK